MPRDSRPVIIDGFVVIAWLVWAGWASWRYFSVPADLAVVVNGPLGVPAYWQEAFARAFRAALGLSIVALAAWACGCVTFRSWRSVAATAGERFVYQLALGFALLSYVLLALAFLHAFRPAIILAALLVAGSVGVGAAVGGNRPPRFALPDTTVERAYAICVIAGIGCALVAALAPEVEYDALWYHLWLPAKWLEAGRPVDIIEEYISLYPLTWEMLYGAAMVVGGPVAAKLLHFVCLPLLGYTAALLTRRLFPAASATLAAALTVTAPIVLWEATTAYVDLALAWYLLLAGYALVRYDEARERPWLVLAAVMVGVALAIKHLALVGLVSLAAGIAWREWRRASARRAVRTVVLFVAIAAVPPAPWYARAYAASRNPVFPELYSFFGAQPAARWTDAAERALQRYKDHFGRDRTLGNLLLLPWDLTVHGARYGGTIGPLFLILAPLAAVSRHRRRSWTIAAAAIAYLAFWASPASSFQMRFLVPLVPLLAILGADAARSLVDSADSVMNRGNAVIVSVVLALLALNLPPTIEWHERDRVGWSGWLTHIVRGLPAPVVLGVESQRAYLARLVPSYRAWQFIDQQLPPDSRVLAFAGGDHLYASRPRIWSDAIAARDVTWATPAGAEVSALRAAAQLHVTHVLFDKRQFDDGSVSAIAIGSERMRSCCLRQLYEDDRYALYVIAPQPAFAMSVGPRRESPHD